MFPEETELPKLGILRAIEVYEFYDEPVLFAALSDQGDVYLITLIDADDYGQSWLCAPMSAERFELVRTGHIELRQAFSATEGGRVFVLKTSEDEGKGYLVETLRSRELGDEQLPEPGERLNVKSPALQGYQPERLQAVAQREYRDVVGLDLKLPRFRPGIIPVKILSSIVMRFQQLLREIGKALYRSRKDEADKTDSHGPQSMTEVLDRLELSMWGLGAGSLKVQLMAENAERQIDLFADTEAGKALDKLMAIISAGGDQDRINEQVRGLEGAPAKQYLDFLKLLDSVAADIRIDWSSPSPGRSRSLILHLQDAKRAIEALSHIDQNPVRVFDVLGHFTMLDLRKNRFELQDGKGANYRGEVVGDAKDLVRQVVMDNAYIATVSEQSEINELLGESHSYYELRALRKA